MYSFRWILDSECDTPWVQGSNDATNCYYVSGSAGREWITGDSACKSLGATLLRPQSYEDVEEIQTMFRD